MARSPAVLKEESAERERRARIAAGVLPYLRTDWDRELREALLRCPEEPRVAVDQTDLESFEMWVRSRGWRRSGFGPNGHRNGFNVFLQPIGRLSLPGPGSSWATDELDGDSDG